MDIIKDMSEFNSQVQIYEMFSYKSIPQGVRKFNFSLGLLLILSCTLLMNF